MRTRVGGWGRWRQGAPRGGSEEEEGERVKLGSGGEAGLETEALGEGVPGEETRVCGAAVGPYLLGIREGRPVHGRSLGRSCVL